MAKIHDLFIVELAEVIKGYGNNPDNKDPFRLSEFYRFYELPNIAVSRENFEKMRPIEPERKTGKWIWDVNGMDWGLGAWCCSECGIKAETWWANDKKYNPLKCSGGNFCGNCGADMRGEQNG